MIEDTLCGVQPLGNFHYWHVLYEIQYLRTKEAGYGNQWNTLPRLISYFKASPSHWATSQSESSCRPSLNARPSLLRSILPNLDRTPDKNELFHEYRGTPYRRQNVISDLSCHGCIHYIPVLLSVGAEYTVAVGLLRTGHAVICRLLLSSQWFHCLSR